MGKSGSAVVCLLCLCCFGVLMGESRPFDFNATEENAMGTVEPEGAEAEPALIMLRHMWQSVQELKRKQNSEDAPAFGQGLAQQLDVLRKLNRRQALRRQLELALEDPASDLEASGDLPQIPDHGDPHFPPETTKPLVLILTHTTQPQ